LSPRIKQYIDGCTALEDPHEEIGEAAKDKTKKLQQLMQFLLLKWNYKRKHL
jgi:hypothetical protein